MFLGSLAASLLVVFLVLRLCSTSSRSILIWTIFCTACFLHSLLHITDVFYSFSRIPYFTSLWTTYRTLSPFGRCQSLSTQLVELPPTELLMNLGPSRANHIRAIGNVWLEVLTISTVPRISHVCPSRYAHPAKKLKTTETKKVTRASLPFLWPQILPIFAYLSGHRNAQRYLSLR
jgi:hypothetical protein